MADDHISVGVLYDSESPLSNHTRSQLCTPDKNLHLCMNVMLGILCQLMRLSTFQVQDLIYIERKRKQLNLIYSEA